MKTVKSAFKFHGGVHPDYNKELAAGQPIETLPRFCIVLLRQSIAPMETDGMSRVYQV